MRPQATRLPERVGSTIAVATGALSRLRGKRFLHPDGVGFQGTLMPLGSEFDATALGTESVAIARLSRAIGLPEALPDLLGLAFRIPDAFGPGLHQDFLMTSCGSTPLGRHLFLPARGFLDRPYTTLLPYRLHGEQIVLEADASGGERPRLSLRDLRRAPAATLEYDVIVRRPGGASRPVARLSLDGRLDDEETERLGFDPTNTGGGLEPAGIVNRIRGPGYRGSQAGRGFDGGRSTS
jgi:hypothetical protein